MTPNPISSLNPLKLLRLLRYRFFLFAGMLPFLLGQAIEELHLSARAYMKVLKVARTIADLDGAERLGAEHLSEAIQYRSLDRNLWA